MANYTYSASDNAGNMVSGTMEARDRQSLADTLRAMGYYPIEIDDRVEGPAAASRFGGLTVFGRVRGRALLDFTRELSGMLGAGVPLDRAVSMLGDIERNGKMKDVLADVLDGIKAGRSFADSLARHPDVFSRVYVATVMSGESSGSLEDALERLASYLESKDRLRDEMTSALIYPSILTVAGGGALAVMLLFVVPRFATLFDGSGAALPLSTRALLFLSEAAAAWWPVALSLAAALSVSLFLSFRRESTRLVCDGAVLRLPLVGPVLAKAAVSRFARTLGTLLRGGIPILESLGVSLATVGNARLASAMDPVVDEVRRGKGLAGSLAKVDGFPPLASYLISVGEETGRLDETLVRLADKYDRDVAVSLKRLLALLEPAIILVMALVVGFIVISLILAIFSVNDLPM